MSGNLTMAGGSIAFNKVQDTEQHIEFLRDGATAYIFANANAIGLYDTQYAAIWTWMYGGDFLIRGAKAWTAGNDGAGSGLDADLLDGRQASDFALLSGAQFRATATGCGQRRLDLFSLRNNQGSASAVGNTSMESVNETASPSPLCNRCAIQTARARLPSSRPRQAAARRIAARQRPISGAGPPHRLLWQWDVPQRQSPLAVGQRRRGFRARCRSARWAAGQLVRGHRRASGICSGQQVWRHVHRPHFSAASVCNIERHWSGGKDRG
jgi:hypothetical protein